MEHSDVVVFLHEFGHLIHWLFAGQRSFATQNFSEIENDVIEAPSQLLEEWVWDYATLKSFATNDAGEAIPEDLVRKDECRPAFRRGIWRHEPARVLRGFARLLLHGHARQGSHPGLRHRVQPLCPGTGA